MKTRELHVHSGRVNVLGLLRGVVLGSVSGVALAVAYAYAILYTPLAGYVTFLFTGCFGLLLGVAIGVSQKAGKTSDPTVAVVTALPVVLGALYVSWAVWVFALLRRHGDPGVPLPSLLLHPRALWGLVRELNAIGPWRLGGMRPTGERLWILWRIEALSVLSLGLIGARNATR